MNKFNAACEGLCSDCFFYYLNGCIATGTVNLFSEINRKQAALIVNRKYQLGISPIIEERLLDKFPDIMNEQVVNL